MIGVVDSQLSGPRPAGGFGQRAEADFLADDRQAVGLRVGQVLGDVPAGINHDASWPTAERISLGDVTLEIMEAPAQQVHEADQLQVCATAARDAARRITEQLRYAPYVARVLLAFARRSRGS